LGSGGTKREKTTIPRNGVRGGGSVTMEGTKYNTIPRFTPADTGIFYDHVVLACCKQNHLYQAGIIR